MPRSNQQESPRSSALPHIFGNGTADRILIALAANRSMNIGEIARALGVRPSTAFTAIRRLQYAGLISKDLRTANGAYVELNRGFAAHRQLRALLLALGQTWAPPHIEFEVIRIGPAREVSVSAALRDLRSPKLTVLAYIAKKRSAGLSKLCADLGMSHPLASVIVNTWQRAGIVQSQYAGKRRIVALDPAFPAHRQLRRFMRAIFEKPRRITPELPY